MHVASWMKSPCLAAKHMARSLGKAHSQTKTWTKSLPAIQPRKDKAQLLTAAHTPLPAYCFIRKLLLNLSSFFR